MATRRKRSLTSALGENNFENQDPILEDYIDVDSDPEKPEPLQEIPDLSAEEGTTQVGGEVVKEVTEEVEEEASETHTDDSLKGEILKMTEVSSSVGGLKGPNEAKRPVSRDHNPKIKPKRNSPKFSARLK